MQSYLYIHKEETSGPQERYRETYALRHVDYELSRSVGRKGEIMSDVRGGTIQVVIDGYPKSLLLGWLFDSVRREDGTIVTLDEHESGMEKLHFNGASVISFRLNFDARMTDGVVTMLTIAARKLETGNELHFQRK